MLEYSKFQAFETKTERKQARVIESLVLGEILKGPSPNIAEFITRKIYWAYQFMFKLVTIGKQAAAG